MEDNQKSIKKLQRTDNITIIRIEDKEINSPKKIANAFNKYFITIADNSTTNNLDEKGVQLLDKCKKKIC